MRRPVPLACSVLIASTAPGCLSASSTLERAWVVRQVERADVGRVEDGRHVAGGTVELGDGSAEHFGPSTLHVAGMMLHVRSDVPPARPLDFRGPDISSLALEQVLSSQPTSLTTKDGEDIKPGMVIAYVVVGGALTAGLIAWMSTWDGLATVPP